MNPVLMAMMLLGLEVPADGSHHAIAPMCDLDRQSARDSESVDASSLLDRVQ